jgi:hypothetical protein
MTPIIATMLVGTGASIAGQLLSAGTQQVAQAGTSSFATALDDAKARVSATGHARGVHGAHHVGRGHHRVLDVDPTQTVTSAAQGAASYRQIGALAVS